MVEGASHDAYFNIMASKRAMEEQGAEEAPLLITAPEAVLREPVEGTNGRS